MTDQLANVKALFKSVTLDGFGARKYVGHDRLDGARNFLHTIVMPKLWQAILADDPAYDPLGDATEAQGTGAVRLFVSCLECFREFESLAHPGEDIWHIFFQSGPEGCFYDDLVTALAQDDPQWSGPVPHDPYPRAVHPNLHQPHTH